MLLGRAAIHVGAALLLGVLSLPAAYAGPISQTVAGKFMTDDQVATIPIVLTQFESLSLTTLSYGGGTNLDGSVSPPGGFEPLLTLFGPSGAFLNSAGGDGTCVAGIASDPATGACRDAVLKFADLGPGSYTLALTQNINYPNGLTLADGFSQAGQGDFTGGICGVAGGSFLQSDLASGVCAQRTGNYAVNIVAANVPEPASIAMLGLGLAGVAVARRRRAQGHRGTI